MGGYLIFSLITELFIREAPGVSEKSKGPATRNDFVNDIVDDERADAIFATLKTIVDDGSSTISSTISLRVAGPLNMSTSTKVTKVSCVDNIV